MGNRAVITTKENFVNDGVGVYLHWNGGRDSVEGFLTYCKLKGYRPPSQDCYGWARLCQVIGNFFGGFTSVGIDVVSKLDCDNYDNGTYIIDGWDVVGREHFNGAEQDKHSLMNMLKEIDKSMPIDERLGEGFLNAKLVNTTDLKIGDKVYIQNWLAGYNAFEILGFGKAGESSGCRDVSNVPYVAGRKFLLEDTYRVAQS